MRAYLTLSSALADVDQHAMVKEAEEFFLLYGISSATQLSCASLPECYIMRYGTEVLAFTKFLQIDPARRIRETAQMIMSVMCPGGLVATTAQVGDRRARDPESSRDARDHPLHGRTRSPHARQSDRPGAAAGSSAARSTRRISPLRC